MVVVGTVLSTTAEGDDVAVLIALSAAVTVTILAPADRVAFAVSSELA